jgi:hypothetical protein
VVEPLSLPLPLPATRESAEGGLLLRQLCAILAALQACAAADALPPTAGQGMAGGMPAASGVTPAAAATSQPPVAVAADKILSALLPTLLQMGVVPEPGYVCASLPCVYLCGQLLPLRFGRMCHCCIHVCVHHHLFVHAAVRANQNWPACICVSLGANRASYLVLHAYMLQDQCTGH